MCTFTAAELVGRTARALIVIMPIVWWSVGLAVITGVAYIAQEPEHIELCGAVFTGAYITMLW